MSNRTRIGMVLFAGSLLVGLGTIVVAAIVETGSWWFLLGVPLWVGLVLLAWDAIVE